MSAESDFRAVLTGYANLTDLVPATRISQNAVDQDVDTPYIVFTAQHNPLHGLDNSVHVTNVQFRVECWADDSLTADEVADEVVAALAADGVVAVARQSGHDPQVGLDATLLTVDWWQ